MRWLLPFILFWFGYGVVAFYTRGGTTEVPQLVGMNLDDALRELASKNLTLRLLEEQEDVTVPAGTILYQSPQAGRLVKSPHSLCVVVAKRVPLPRAPQCLGLSRQAVETLAQKNGLRVHMVTIDGVMHITDSCFAQWPQVGEEVGEQGLLVYIAGSSARQKIMPDFKNYPLEVVCDFCKNVGWKSEIIGDLSANGIVIEQRPLAGSFIDDQKPVNVKLKVTEQHS